MSTPNPIMEALETVGVRALVSVTSQVPLEPKGTYQQRRLMSEIAARSELQEKCQSCVDINETTQAHPEHGFVTAMTTEVVVMSKRHWIQMLRSVYLAGRNSVPHVSGPPVTEAADARR